MSNTPNTDALSDILRRVRLSAEIYARPEYCGTWAVDTSGQKKVAFHLIQEGSAWLHLDDDTIPEPLVTGDLVIFPHDARHALSSSSETPKEHMINRPPPPQMEGPITSLLCGYFSFEDDAAYQLLVGLPEVIRVDLRGSESASGTVQLLRLIVSELTRDEPGVDAVVDELALVLFVHVLRSQMSGNLDGGLLAALADRQIGKAINRIHTDLGADWSVDGLAAEVAMSRSSFARRFKELVGMSPMRYVATWRMNEATTLLRETNKSTLEIAERVGYVSEAAFRKAFKSMTGKSPGRVRKGAD